MSDRKTMLSRFRSRKALPASTRIFVKGLLIQASIGVHQHEYEATQPIVIDVELDMADMKLPEEDRLHETLDYGLVADKCEELALEAHVQLVETLAARIADWALSADPRVKSVAVRIAKPQALLKADTAGVEVVKSR